MIGRHGGYRLRPGFKLPPLMFTEEEATAIALGLLGTAWLEIGLSTAAIEGALAKVSRVLPQRARERMNAVAAHMILSPHRLAAQPDAELLINLSEAIPQPPELRNAFLQLAEQMTQIAGA
jgi:predicted DNA-binding transcriptional regulator YafY